MRDDQQQLSPHRHISFTAHYTGYIWYQLGWSHAALASRKGHRLAALMHPLELLNVSRSSILVVALLEEELQEH